VTKGDRATLSDSIAITRYGGSASQQELNPVVQEQWAQIRSDPKLLAKAASYLQVTPAKLLALEHAPVEVRNLKANITAPEIALEVITWIGTDVCLGLLADVAKDEIKRRVRSLWDAMFAPKLHQGRDSDTLSREMDIESQG